jgi:hypothetical protein
MNPKEIPSLHSPLPPGHDGIRLLRLLPNKTETAEIKCLLFVYALESGKHNHLYEALSYVWDDPKKTVPIVIGEHRFNITENLYAALPHLRNHTLERIIWVDAICTYSGRSRIRLLRNLRCLCVLHVLHAAAKFIIHVQFSLSTHFFAILVSYSDQTSTEAKLVTNKAIPSASSPWDECRLHTKLSPLTA